jgi:hypothetical protein
MHTAYRTVTWAQEFLLIYSIPKPAALHLMTLLYRLDMA